MSEREPLMAGRILVVDDEAHILHVLSLKLRNAGYEVLTAVDGEDGYELASQHVRSVPALTSENAVRTSTLPALQIGAGTSVRLNSPVW